MDSNPGYACQCAAGYEGEACELLTQGECLQAKLVYACLFQNGEFSPLLKKDNTSTHNFIQLKSMKNNF